MKKLLLIISMFIAYLGSNAQGVWVSQATGFNDVSSGLRDIEVVDTNVVWAISYDGSGANLPRQDYTRTIDGGTNWVTGAVPTTAIWDWAHLDAINADTAWAVFFNTAVSPVGLGQVWHTTNGGTNWTQQGAGSIYVTAGESFPNVVHFWDGNNGVIIGDPANNEFEIYTTTDGGTTWTIVPGTDIPDPIDATEAGWTTHIDVVGDDVWFDTNHGRVYHSTDKGYHWTVSATNLSNPVPGSIDICFMNSMNGIARYYDDVAITNDATETSDGGLTWTPFLSIGSMFGAGLEHVPGTASMLVSTGVSAQSGFTGSSYSMDGGHNWSTIDQGVQRNALGIADSLTMWCGGFTTSPTSGGVFKFLTIPLLACTDASVSPGVTTASDTAICGGDTVFVTSTGVVAPVTADFSGVTWAISASDISGNNAPTSDPTYIGSFRLTFPAPSTDNRFLVNDGSFVDGTNVPYGVYYFTPVVYGNGLELNSPATWLHDLFLDGACTFTGTSVAVDVIDPNDTRCFDRVGEVKGIQLAVFASIQDRTTLDVQINSATYGKVNIQILDVTGRIVNTASTYVTKGTNHELINVENLATGTYVIKAQVNGNFATNKIVKF
jgi:hypothetical protein